MPSAHIYRVTWSGIQGGGPEIWSYMRHIASTTLWTPQEVAEAVESHVGVLLDTVVTGVSAAVTVGDAFPPDVTWQAVKAAEIDPATNKYKTGVDPFTVAQSATGNTAGFVGLPLPDSLSITTRSSGLGRRRYNRFYLPRFTAAVTDGKGRVAVGLIDAIIDGLVACQSDLEIQLDSGSSYCNFSEADHTDKAIVDYYVGDVLDTQRSRRDQLVEARTVRTL